MAKIPYILSQISNLSIVSEPLRRSSRIKYTCFNVSQNYIVFGASSGGLYVFKREPCAFLQLLPSTEGAVTLVSISPCETFVAFSTARGSLCVVGLESKVALRLKRISREHDDSAITAIQWSARCTEVYVGDSLGRISVLTLLSYMLSLAPLMQLDSRVVQIDRHCHLLLVSTLSRSYLCDTVHEQYRQIGSQLRDGPYGACFHNVGEEFQVSSDIEREASRYAAPFSSLREGERLLSDERLRNVKVYCARPGCRLWEVLIDGSVLNTHQLKRALAVPPSPVLALDKNVEDVSPVSSETRQSSFNFSKLYRAVDNKFLLAFHSDGIYLLDPGVEDVVTWTDTFTGITDVQIVNNMIYLWCSDGRLHAVTVLKLDALLVWLYLQTKYVDCAKLISEYENQLTAMVTESPRLYFMPELAKKIEEEDIGVADKVSEVVKSLAQIILAHSQERQKALKLESGIFLVGNEYTLTQLNSSQPKIQIRSYRDALLRKRKGNDDNHQNGYINTKNDVNLLKIEDDLRSTSSCDSSDIENSSDDLDDVFQLLGISKQEMKIALKDMGNTITDTLSSSTRSVKKSLRLLVMKQNLGWAAANGLNSFPADVELEADINLSSESQQKSLGECKGTRNTGSSNFIEACENVSNYSASDRKSLQEYVFDLLESMVFLCDRYGSLTPEDVNDIILGRRSEPYYKYPSIKDIFSRWLRKKKEKHSPTFPQMFEEDILTQIRTHLHGSLKSGTLVAWIRNNLPEVSESGQLYPDFMINIYNENEFLIDRVLSEFLKTTASLLDPFIILQCLSACKSPCVYFSWNQIMDLCQHGKLHKEKTAIKDMKMEDWPLPVTLNAILIMLDLRQVEYCSAAPIKDIVYIILRLQSKEMKSGKSASAVFEKCGNLFMRYLHAVPPTEISQALDDAEVRMFVLTLLKQLKCYQNNFESCSCGFPQPFSSEDLIKHRISYANICKSLILWLKCNDEEKLREFCRTNPLFWPAVLAARRSDSVEVILPIIIQMGDFLELEHRLDEMTDELWANAFHLCAALGDNACLNCSEPLKSPLKLSETEKPDPWRLLWQRFTELILRKLGPRETMRLLSNHKDVVPHGTIDVRFLKLCSIAALLDPLSGNLSRHVVDSLSNAPRKIPNIPAFSPSSVENLEKRGFSTDFLPLPIGKTSSSHHWGVKINFEVAVCPFCLLSLGSPVVVEKGGVTVFRCAHGFHTVCLRRRSHSQKYSGCPVCQPNVAETIEQ